MSGYDLEALQVSAAYRLEARLAEHVAAAERRIWRPTPTEILEGRTPPRRTPSERQLSTAAGLGKLAESLQRIGPLFVAAADKFAVLAYAAAREREQRVSDHLRQGLVCSCRYSSNGPYRACKL